MGIVERFEHNIEKVVNGVFARAFKTQVEPIELVSGMRKEVDSKAVIVGRSRTIIPNAFTITLAETDYDRFHEWEGSLADELAGSLTEHARQQQYSFVGPIMIRFQREAHLDTGVFHIVSSQQKGTVPAVTPDASPPDGDYSITVAGERYVLAHGRTIVGRGSDANIVLDDTGVSRHHAQFTVDTAGVVLQDLGSTNGTFVNGQRITTVRIHEGDNVSLGRLTLTLNAPEARSSSPNR